MSWNKMIMIFVVLIGLFGPRILLADGAFFAQAGVARPVEIPAQRALISFRDGQETLIIESGLDSESEKLGWVVPLPAEPTLIEAATPGILKTLSFCVQPRVAGTHIGPFLWAMGLALLLALVAMLGALAGRQVSAASVCLFLIVPLAILLLLPALSSVRTAGASASQGIEILSFCRAGSYEVSVLRADRSKDLDRWLKEGDLTPLPDEGRKIVDEYIREGWCFAVARLAREKGGKGIPHPLQVKFPAARPVYPMRLTALARSTPRFELFVLADRQASHPLLETESVDRYRMEPYREDVAYQGDAHGQRIGHPGLKPLLWNGCVLSKLVGEASPARMKEDFVFGLEDVRPCRKTVYARDSAGRFGIGIGFMVCSMGLFVGIWAGGRFDPDRRRRLLEKGMLLSLTLGLAAGVYAYATTPTVEVRSVSRRTMRHELAIELLQIAQERGFLDPLSEREWEGAVAKHQNPLTGRSLLAEDSPGNFRISAQGGRPVAFVYDDIGREIRVDLGEVRRVSATESRTVGD